LCHVNNVAPSLRELDTTSRPNANYQRIYMQGLRLSVCNEICWTHTETVLVMLLSQWNIHKIRENTIIVFIHLVCQKQSGTFKHVMICWVTWAINDITWKKGFRHITTIGWWKSVGQLQPCGCNCSHSDITHHRLHSTEGICAPAVHYRDPILFHSRTCTCMISILPYTGKITMLESIPFDLK